MFRAVGQLFSPILLMVNIFFKQIQLYRLTRTQRYSLSSPKAITSPVDVKNRTSPQSTKQTESTTQSPNLYFVSKDSADSTLVHGASLDSNASPRQALEGQWVELPTRGRPHKGLFAVNPTKATPDQLPSASPMFSSVGARTADDPFNDTAKTASIFI